ncbi:MAG: hypothetical protein M1821_001943 [Bathelium mastoideum]|nr:MAG: hypothetical protein M1821_001943 [Bathelium mastoideum]KAI9692452.1 MAG: hypothetical protein M1822_006683 [Bathelium mastoideum]
MDKSYSSFVRAFAARNPRLSLLAEALTKCSHWDKSSGGIGCIKFQGRKVAGSGATDLQQVISEIESLKVSGTRATGLCVLIEDIHPNEINKLGAVLDADPHFFSDHIATGPEYPDKRPAIDSESVLPSQIYGDGFVNLHYQRVIDLGEHSALRDIPYSLNLEGNSRRPVRRMPPILNRDVGLARACFSIMRKQFANETWICVMLMDSASSDIIFDPHDANEHTSTKFRAAQTPYRSHFRGSTVLPTYSSFLNDSIFRPQRSMNMLDGVLDSLLSISTESTEGEPSIMEMTLYPIRMIITEWMIYSLMMGRYVKLYEYSVDTLHKEIRSPDGEDIIDLYRWRRRSQQSLNKLRRMTWFIKQQDHTHHQLSNVLIEDIDHISGQIKQHAEALQTTIPILTSMIQLVDARRAIEETRYIKRLSYITLIFLPLTYVATLFSMSEPFALNDSGAWIYIATALPLLLMVLIFSSVSFQLEAIVKRVKHVCLIGPRTQNFTSTQLRHGLPYHKNVAGA